MEKLVYVVWRAAGSDVESLSDRLRGPVADALHADGARGVQVNVTDAEVADAALNRAPWGRPADAMMSLWVDSSRDEVRQPLEKTLQSAADGIAGWLVTESVPLAPPRLPPGERTAGLSNMAFIRRPESMTPADWIDRWHNHHTRVAIETQATFGYVQNTVVRSLTPEAFPVDGIVEELFPIEACTDQHAFWGSGGDPDELARRQRSMSESVSAFLEGAATGVMPTSRYVLSSPFA